MRSIVEADSLIKKLACRKIDKTRDYRLLKYLLFLDTEYGRLIHNVLTGELICLSKEEEAMLDELPIAYDSKLDSLIERFFLVPVEYDEKKAVCQLRMIMRKLEKKKPVTAYSIYPTTFCNAKCFYCFESGFKREHMSYETARTVSNYIISNAQENMVSIRWFGGEPLVGIERIRQICQCLQANNVQFYSSMVSNGYLFTDLIIKEAIQEWHLKNVQITLDGTMHNYNRIKAYNNFDENPFATVLDNIDKLICNGIIVSIRLNVDEQNAEDLFVLTNDLMRRYQSHRGKIFFYARAILPNDGFVPKQYNDEDKRKILNAVLQLNKLIDGNGFKNKKNKLPKLAIRSCWADGMYGKHITPAGNFKFCDHEVDIYGSVYSDKEDIEKISEWRQYLDLDHCGECPLYPECVKLKKCFDMSECTKISKDQSIQEYHEIMLEILKEAGNERV